MGRKIILYDLYKDDEYQGRYKAKELMYLLGMSRETIASRVYHGVKTKDGYRDYESRAGRMGRELGAGMCAAQKKIT